MDQRTFSMYNRTPSSIDLKYDIVMGLDTTLGLKRYLGTTNNADLEKSIAAYLDNFARETDLDVIIDYCSARGKRVIAMKEETSESTLFCINCLVAPMAIGLHCVGCHDSILADLRGKAQYDTMPIHDTTLPVDENTCSACRDNVSRRFSVIIDGRVYCADCYHDLVARTESYPKEDSV